MQTTISIKNNYFSVLNVEDFSPIPVIDVANGTAGALQVKDFFHKHEVEEIFSNFQKIEFSRYDTQIVSPQINKLGPAAYDFYNSQQLSSKYWEESAQATIMRKNLFSLCDPLTLAMDRIEKAWGRKIRLATHDGKTLFAGMIRQINAGARMHYDNVVQEFPNFLDERPLVQLAFNCFLESPEVGGDALVFDRKWTPKDESQKEGYGYSKELILGHEMVKVPSVLGGANLFDPRNYHLVEPVIQGSRTTLSFFMGILPNGEIIIWS